MGLSEASRLGMKAEVRGKLVPLDDLVTDHHGATVVLTSTRSSKTIYCWRLDVSSILDTS